MHVRLNDKSKVSPLFYITAVILTMVVICFAFTTHKGNFLTTPHRYGGDALATGATVKTIIETGYYSNNPKLGAPDFFSPADYPASDSASYVIIRLLSFFSSNFVVVVNLFYFLTFILVTLAALYAFLQLGLNKANALAASLLFSFLPYHYLRGTGHLFLSAYYVVPLYILMLFDVYNTSREEKTSVGKYALYAGICFISASTGVYYAFFASFLLFIAGAIAGAEKKTWRPLVKAFILIAFISVTVVANTAPTIVAKHLYGENKEVAHRQPVESEIAALKISQLLLPINNHRLKSFAKLRRRYDASAPLVNENQMATLGFIGGLGFLALIGIAFLRTAVTDDRMLVQMSSLNLAAVLYTTIGGFCSMFAYIFTPMIRSNNRISVFIAFLSLFAFFSLLQKLDEKYKPKQYLYYVLISLILVLGLLDEIPKHDLTRSFDDNRAAMLSDQKFVGEIERIMPAGSMIFQLPVAGFPENPMINNMTDYQLFRGYLYSHNLHWSYGAMRGRPLIKWQESVGKLPVEQMVRTLIGTGFSGIYINLDGYKPEAGVELVGALTRLTGFKPLYDGTGRLVFFDLRAYRTQSINHISG